MLSHCFWNSLDPKRMSESSVWTLCPNNKLIIVRGNEQYQSSQKPLLLASPGVKPVRLSRTKMKAHSPLNEVHTMENPWVAMGIEQGGWEIPVP